MQVFHYCAEQLHGVNLFETCSDRDLLKSNQEGAVYSSFNAFRHHLRAENESNEESEMSDNEIPAISQSDIDMCFLQADEDDKERWIIDSEYFDNELDPSSWEYMRKVYLITQYDFDDLDVYDDHIKRLVKILFFMVYCVNM